MQVSRKIYLLAALIGILGISSCARTSTPAQAQVDKSVPTTQQPQANTQINGTTPATSTPTQAQAKKSVPTQQPQASTQIDVTTPVEATDEATERERETQDKQVPTVLTNVGNYGEALYDTAKADDWTKASANLKLLQ